MTHWTASKAKNSQLEDECEKYGFSKDEIEQAKSSGDPQALEKLLAKAPQEVDVKDRYLDNLVGVRPVDDKKE
eukprot:COSAG02_NODE_48518_length_333_cov_0.799145_1_plen_72_part_10